MFLDLGLIHKVKDVRVEKGLRYAIVRCGAKLRPDPASERQTEWTVWESEVTCPECKL